MSKRRVSVMFLASLWCAFAVGWASPAGASSHDCNFGGHPNTHDGINVPPNDSSYMDKAKALITLRQASLCATDSYVTNFVTAYVMLHSGDLGGFAQIGYLKDATTNGWSVFSQWRKCDGCSATTTDIASATVGHTHTFVVKRGSFPACTSNSGYCLALQWDGATEGYTEFDPHLEWNRSIAEFSGETDYPGTDMPGISGSSGDKTSFMNLVETDAGADVSAPWTVKSNPCDFYKFGNPNGNNVYTDFNIWTEPLSHAATC